jgi:hypothetical protein
MQQSKEPDGSEGKTDAASPSRKSGEALAPRKYAVNSAAQLANSTFMVLVHYRYLCAACNDRPLCAKMRKSFNNLRAQN